MTTDSRKPEEPKPGDAPLLRTIVDDPEAFARNLARMVEEGGRAMAAYLGPRERGAPRSAGQEGLTDVVKTLAHVGEYWMRDPQRAVEAQARLWSSYMGLWGSTLRRISGEPAPAAAEAEPGDRRFRDPDWSENRFFDFMKQAYLIGSRWAEDMVREADEVDEHTRHKAEFYVRQIVAALSPSNFVLTNPELLRETLASNGENLARGMKMLADDIKAGGGELKIRQTGDGGFKVGENLATTPGKVIFENDICQIIQYAPTTETVLARPLLVVPPWINKFYILDLTPEKSFVKWAVDQGHTVFLVSWVNPDAAHATKGFEDYMRDGILAGVDVALRASGADGVNAVGYCVGGTLLGMALAYLAAKGDDRIRSATFFTAQVDFTHAGDLKVFVDDEQIEALERLMAERGYLPGDKMAGVFNMMRSQDLIWPYVVNNYIRGKEPFPFDLLHWNSDSTRLPAANHSFYLRSCYLDNKLVKGEITLGGERLDLGKVTVPIYTLATREDHIAPAKSVFLGARYFGGPVRFVLAGSGHIAGVVNHPGRNKYQHWTGGAPVGMLEDWIAAAEEHPGSWWPDWQRWIEATDGGRIPAREVGGGVFAPIEDAPGRYVKVVA